MGLEDFKLLPGNFQGREGPAAFPVASPAVLIVLHRMVQKDALPFYSLAYKGDFFDKKHLLPWFRFISLRRHSGRSALPSYRRLPKEVGPESSIFSGLRLSPE